MNLYLRLLKVLILIWFSPRKGIMDESRLSFRVWPHDCDLNMHLNNGRYLTFMDLGRIHLIGQIKLLSRLIKNRWMPVLGAAEINFIRPVKPLQKFSLTTRMLGWDEKYFYIEQRFTVEENKLCAAALVKGLFVAGGEKVKPEDILRLAGPLLPPPEMPDTIKQWNQLLAMKRQLP
jgi:acyl-CoA thioesterase FadM